MDELQQLKLLAGIGNRPNLQPYTGLEGSNISITGNEKAQLMREHDIKPGTEAWFRLWFSRPFLTNEKPI